MNLFLFLFKYSYNTKILIILVHNCHYLPFFNCHTRTYIIYLIPSYILLHHYLLIIELSQVHLSQLNVPADCRMSNIISAETWCSFQNLSGSKINSCTVLTTTFQLTSYDNYFISITDILILVFKYKRNFNPMLTDRL